MARIITKNENCIISAQGEKVFYMSCNENPIMVGGVAPILGGMGGYWAFMLVDGVRIYIGAPSGKRDFFRTQAAAAQAVAEVCMALEAVANAIASFIDAVNASADWSIADEAQAADIAADYEDSEVAERIAAEEETIANTYISTAEDMVKRIAAEQEQAEQTILEQAEAMQFEAEVEQAEAEHVCSMKSDLSRLVNLECSLKPTPLVFNIESIIEMSESESRIEQAEAENTETETETRQAVLGIDAWKKQATPMHFGIGSRAGVSLLAAQKMIRGGIIHDLNRLKAQLEQVDARIALLEREEAALERRVTRLSAQDLSDFEPDKAARYTPELCEAWLRAMLKTAGIELVNLFRPYQDATDVFKIECGCSIEEFRERAHNAGFRPYSIVPIKGTSRSAWLYIQIGKP